MDILFWAAIGLIAYALAAYPFISLLLTGKAGITVPLVSSIALFVVANITLGVGAVRCMIGDQMRSWEPVR